MSLTFEILNALSKTEGREATMTAVRAWLGIQEGILFLEANPGLAFGNEGALPKPLNPDAGAYSPMEAPAPSDFEEVSRAYLKASADGLALLAEAAEQRSVEEQLAALAERVAETVLEGETA
jgi:hypothetical protein